MLVLAALASVLAVGAATRAQIDTRLAAYAAAAARADFVATGLLQALLDDLATRLQAGKRISAAPVICADAGVCAANNPRVAAALRRIPDELVAQLALVERSAGEPVYLREAHAAAQRSQRMRVFEARVTVSGVGEAALAATFAVVEPRFQEPGG